MARSCRLTAGAWRDAPPTKTIVWRFSAVGDLAKSKTKKGKAEHRECI